MGRLGDADRGDEVGDSENDSQEGHALVFAKLGEGYTVDEAYERLEGKKGSATEVIRGTGAEPGKSVTAEVTESLDAGNYVLLCPIAGKDGPHYKLGQLAEFAMSSGRSSKPGLPRARRQGFETSVRRRGAGGGQDTGRIVRVAADRVEAAGAGVGWSPGILSHRSDRVRSASPQRGLVP